jgi:nicotinamide-nucleotide amidase
MPQDLSPLAASVLEAAERAGATLAVAESCTGGHIASLLTGIEGRSHMFEAGFVTYSDKAKSDVLGIPAGDVERYGAVSKQVALAMAAGAVRSSRSKIAVSVTGFTGGAPPGEENGLVHIAVAEEAGPTFHREYHFGEVERDERRNLAASAALAMLKNALAAGSMGEDAA